MQNRLLKLIRFVDGAEPVLQYLLFRNYKIGKFIYGSLQDQSYDPRMHKTKSGDKKV
jgi:hypothetical protein